MPIKIGAHAHFKTPWRDGTTHLVISPLECGHIEPGNRACNDVFACLRCAHQADADVNAASNIRDGAKGLWGDADSTALLLA